MNEHEETKGWGLANPVSISREDLEDCVTALNSVICGYGDHKEQTANCRAVRDRIQRQLNPEIAVNHFSNRTGAYVSFCKGCDIWTVHCPECQTNFCGGGCDCGYETVQQKWQDKLDILVNQ